MALSAPCHKGLRPKVRKVDVSVCRRGRVCRRVRLRLPARQGVLDSTLASAGEAGALTVLSCAGRRGRIVSQRPFRPLSHNAHCGFRRSHNAAPCKALRRSLSLQSLVFSLQYSVRNARAGCPPHKEQVTMGRAGPL